MAIERYQRRDGSMVFMASFYGPDGTKIRETVTSLKPNATATAIKRAEDKARAVAAERRTQVENGTFIPKGKPAEPKRIILRDMFKMFLVSYRSARGTNQFYADHSRPLLDDPISDKVADEITRQDVVDYRERRRRKGASVSTLQKDLAILTRLFYWAAEQSPPLTTNFPLRKLPRLKPEKRRIVTYSADDLERIVRHAPPWLGRMVRLACLTGIDRGDLCRMTWAEVDRNHGTIYAKRSKTGEDAFLPLTPEIDGILAECGRVRGKDDCSPVFLDEHGTPINTRQAGQALARVLRRAGLDPHDPFRKARHTAATNFLRSGGNAYSLKTFLRHATPGMSFRYVEVTREDLAETMKNMGKRSVGESEAQTGENPGGPESAEPSMLTLVSASSSGK